MRLTDEATGVSQGRTALRKAEHLQINLSADVQAKGVTAGFERYRLAHNALPQLAFDDVDTGVEALGQRLGAPLLISCMTGGAGTSGPINRTLALVAQEHRLAMGLGSMRVVLDDPTTIEDFRVRGVAPDVLLLANVGAVQLNYGVTAEDCRRLVEAVEANALVLHLNALQEALQPEGDADFRGLEERIGEVCAALPVPVIVKEVGWGISADVARRLFAVGVAGVDVAGSGGTSWSEVERHRLRDEVAREAAAAFRGWGNPTAECVREVRAIAGDRLVIGSGGVRDPLDVALALALGADLVGAARPFLLAASESLAALDVLIRTWIAVLRLVMFSTGSRTPRELRRAGLRDLETTAELRPRG